MRACSGGYWAAREATFDVRVVKTSFGRGLVDCVERANASTCVAADLDAWLYVPACSSGSCPPPVNEAAGMVVLHRGGYVSSSPCGSCIDAVTARFFAARGLLVANVDYRLRGDDGNAPTLPSYENKFQNAWRVDPAAMYAATRDAKLSVHYLRETLGVGCVFAAGSSAGGVSALALGAFAQEPGVYWDEVADRVA